MSQHYHFFQQHLLRCQRLSRLSTLDIDDLDHLPRTKRDTTESDRDRSCPSPSHFRSSTRPQRPLQSGADFADTVSDGRYASGVRDDLLYGLRCPIAPQRHVCRCHQRHLQIQALSSNKSNIFQSRHRILLHHPITCQSPSSAMNLLTRTADIRTKWRVAHQNPTKHRRKGHL